MTHIDPYQNRQLFIDDSAISETCCIAKTLNQPVKYAGNPILRPSLPWERDAGFVGTVLRDDDGSFRAWYQGWYEDRYPACYATSMDGIFWHKPDLGLIEVAGSSANNRIMEEACVPNVIHDPRDPDPERRYKMLYWDFSIPRPQPKRPASVSVAFSSDGIRWTEFDGNPVLTGTGDTHSLLGWDDNVGKYVAYVRPGRDADKGINRRLVGRSVSDDFTSWSEPEIVLQPDHDEPDLEFYNMPVFKYEGLYLGLPWGYYTYPEEPHGRMGGTMDVQLAVSHDGVQWSRAGDRQPFIPIGPRGSLDQGMVACAKEPVRVGDELWFYGSGSDGDHGSRHRNGRGFLSKLRLDGFVSLDAGSETGWMITQPFVCQGGELEVNAYARGGVLEVAVLGADGMQVDGMRHIDCAPFDSDSVRQRITWENHVSFDHLKGQTLRLKFYLTSTRLYSFGFAGA